MRLGPADIGKGLIDYSRSIIALFKQKMDRALWLWSAVTADLPTDSGLGANEGAIAYDETLNTLTFFDSANWLAVFGVGGTAADARANLGLGSAALTSYVEGTFTPVVKFGGASVGMTYATQVGTYVKIGRMVNFVITITLSAKGTSVGNCTVTGLPFTSSAADTPVANAVFQSMSGVIANGAASIPGGGTALFALKMTGGSLAFLDDTDFTNTSSVYISGFYYV